MTFFWYNVLDLCLRIQDFYRIFWCSFTSHRRRRDPLDLESIPYEETQLPTSYFGKVTVLVSLFSVVTK